MKSFKENITQNKGFDYIIQNPPYDGSKHLDFFKKGLEVLASDGKMNIIEPATWLINVRKNGKAKIYDALKEQIKDHVRKVIIENYNKTFNTTNTVPFSITYIDFSKNHYNMEFICFGEKQLVSSLYDCNMIGAYNVIHSIFNKINKFDNLNAHLFYNKEPNINDKYLTISYIVPSILGKYSSSPEKRLSLPGFTKNTVFGDYALAYINTSYLSNDSTIYQNPPKAKKRGASKEYTDKDAVSIVGTCNELENWKYFSSHNKLPFFINMCLTIDAHNNSYEYLPWVVDKKYSDNEINKLFGFSKEEIELMDKTIKKFECHSPWFKRYMCGENAVSNKEVQNFIDNI